MSTLARLRAGRLFRPLAQAGMVVVLVLGIVAMVTPASGAANDIATGFARAVRQLRSSAQTGAAFSGTAAVGALFSTSNGQLKSHFCTASIVNSPNGDLAITAAHCVTGLSGTVEFVPEYHSGIEPYGAWTVTKIYTDQAWQSSANPDDDFAFLQLSRSGSSTPVEDVTGAEQLDTSTQPAGEQVEVIGYPDGETKPISCQNSLKKPMPDQLEFDCGAYTTGTSGGPFLTDVNPSTGQGRLIGIIGGYEQGGDTPQVSYSAALGASAAALYQTAVAGG